MPTRWPAFCRPCEQSESSVAALVGSWGSSKTTLIEEIGKSLIEEIGKSLAESGWYVTTHNPWAYSDHAGAVAGFFSAIRDAVPDDVVGKRWRESLGGCVSRAAPIGAAGGAPHWADVQFVSAGPVSSRKPNGYRSPTRSPSGSLPRLRLTRLRIAV
ncbi:P-loop NTPase fold protein [Nocardioides insulae]|uniref:P-loop NTPase fold protein n=1 Tax=Nocardioides insulae TaxID=394734 RepID=UPI00146DF31B